MLAEALAVVSLSSWVYLLGFRGSFWRSSPVLRSIAPATLPRVAALVPARNEAENVGTSVGSLLAQDYPGRFAVILVDDNSTDGTGQLAASLDHTGRLTVIEGTPLPPGWTGKLWAVNQALAHPAARAADYVLLTDADIEHAPAHLSALVANAEVEQLDLVSEMVRLHCDTFAERALVPAFVFFFQMLYPFRWVADPANPTAGAAGGTMLIRRSTLDSVEGLTEIRNELIDDCALARRIKAAGGRIWLGHAELAVSTRVYSTWRNIWEMIARTAYVQLGRSPRNLLGCVLGITIIYCVPPALTLFSHGLPRLAAAAAWAAMAAAFQPTLRRYRRSPLWGLALPGIAVFYLAATVASAVQHHRGRGGRWKERVYPELPV